MVSLPKKTYSRRNHELSVVTDKEKENVDPFDELLSSPLKQEVQFQPLSFWGTKVRCLKSKKKTEKVDCGLFEASDSDDINSPCQRKRKPKSKYKETRARTLPPKSRSHKLNVTRKNHSTACAYDKKSKNCEPISTNQGKNFVSTKKFENSLKENISELSSTKKHLRNSNSVTKPDTDFHSVDSTFYSVKNSEVNLSDVLYDVNFNKQSTLGFKIYEDTNLLENQEGTADDKTVILNRKENSVDCYFDNSMFKTVILNSKEDSVNSIGDFNENIDKTLTPFQSGHDGFKFVNKRRHFIYPDSTRICNTSLNNSSVFKESDGSSNWLMEEEETISRLNNSKLSDVSMSEDLSRETDDETLTYSDHSTVETAFQCDESRNRNFQNERSVPYLSEDLLEISMVESESSMSECLVISCTNKTDLEELILELQNANLVDDLVESNSTSDETLSSFNDEDTVIKIGLKTTENVSPSSGSDVKNDVSAVSFLTTGMSDLSISNTTCEMETESEIKKINNFECDSDNEDKEKNSFPIDSQNVNVKRRGVKNNRLEKNTSSRLSSVKGRTDKEVNGEMDFDQSVWMPPGRTSLDWNKTISFANPVFESTRFFDTSPKDDKKQSVRLEKTDCIQEETRFGFDGTFSLKPGKKWFRSMSVLKQLQNGSIVGGRLESTRLTGRKFESFVQDMLQIHNEKSNFFSLLADGTISDKNLTRASIKNAHFSSRRNTILECEKSLQDLSEEKSSAEDSVFLKSLSNNTCLENTSLNRTVKVIEPEKEPSAFRSALGVQNSRSGTQKVSVEEESSVISARDFILMQCGQKDVVSFEENFNEKTLKNCRKIGEGVYGEVFMCSDSVIKIIPIEGSDKVNGEPQKTFEEIISEVVIAAKLSNLRRGEKYRTDGFSEMKRCWCVKGKYPKYLLQLWNEYDQLGSGSENDSPVMFKDEQLYIILELANGGKDLESFVFSSSAQSLSIFIQAAYSLAAAEKAFEFEHRDLHWGNILISETKDKFTSVVLEGIEYKIPTKGVKVCIIDFTLSRINHEGCCIFNDLSVDPSLFASEGDYQFEIYRLMLREVKNDWSLFRPKTNIYWLHYTIDKMIKMVRYKNKKGKVHAKYLKELKSLENVVLEHKNSTDLVLSEFLNDVVNKM